MTQMLLGFDGRIRRRDWWLWGIGVIVLAWILQSVASAALGVNFLSSVGGQVDVSTLRNASIASTVIGLLFIWPVSALSVKRAHDRDMSAWSVLPFYGLYAILAISSSVLGVNAAAAGLTDGRSAAPSEVMEMFGAGGMLVGVLAIGVLVYALFLLVVLGFLDGTPGQNEYGPSPKGLGSGMETFA